MPVLDTRKSRLPAIICIILLCAFGAAFGVGKYLEYRRTEFLRAAIDRIPAQYAFTVKDVTGSLFGGQLTLKDVSVTLPSRDGNAQVSMESVAIQGLSVESLAASGKTFIADSVTITNMKTIGGSFEAATEYCALTDFSADLPKMAAEWADTYLEGVVDPIVKLARPVLAGARPSEIPARNTALPLSYSAKRYISKGDRVTFTREGNLFALLIASSEVGNFSGDHCGPMAFKDIHISTNGKTFLTLAEFGLAEADGLLAGDGLDQEGAFWSRNPFDRDVVIDDFYIKGLALNLLLHGDVTSPVTTEDARMTLRFSDNRQMVNLAVTALTMEKKLFLAKIDESMADLPFPLDELTGFLPESLVVEGRISMTAAPLPEGGITVLADPVSLSVRGLGAAFTRISLQGKDELETDQKIGLLEISLTDEGVSDMVFALTGKNQGKTAKYARQEARMALSVAGLAAQGPLAELIAHSLDFLEKPGATLTLKVEPKEPLDPDSLGNALILSPGEAGLSSSVSRENSSPEASGGM